MCALCEDPDPSPYIEELRDSGLVDYEIFEEFIDTLWKLDIKG